MTPLSRIFCGATTLSIMAFSIMTFSINGLYVTLSISDTQHNNTAIMLSVAFYSLLSWMLLCWMLLCWVSLCWVSLCWVSLCWMSLWWVSWRLFCRIICQIGIVKFNQFSSILHLVPRHSEEWHSSEWHELIIMELIRLTKPRIMWNSEKNDILQRNTRKNNSN
jgi:hypothetical protein